jgi:nucleoid DNA-binding protein
MKRADIVKRMARRAGAPQSEMADQLDRAVADILTRLRRGKPASLPGIGVFKIGQGGEITFERQREGGQ